MLHFFCDRRDFLVFFSFFDRFSFVRWYIFFFFSTILRHLLQTDEIYIFSTWYFFELDFLIDFLQQQQIQNKKSLQIKKPPPSHQLYISLTKKKKLRLCRIDRSTNKKEFIFFCEFEPLRNKKIETCNQINFQFIWELVSSFFVVVVKTHEINIF